jgi:hypothetical protein
MRGLMISFAIIIFCFSVQIVNEIGAQHDAEYALNHGMAAGGYTSLLFACKSVTPLSTSSTQFQQFQQNNTNSTMANYINAAEQMTGISLYQWYGYAAYLVRGLTFIMTFMLNATFGFGTFIQNLGNPCMPLNDQGVAIPLVPDVVATVLNVLVGFFQVFTILQIATSRDLRGGA